MHVGLSPSKEQDGNPPPGHMDPDVHPPDELDVPPELVEGAMQVIAVNELPL